MEKSAFSWTNGKRKAKQTFKNASCKQWTCSKQQASAVSMKKVQQQQKQKMAKP